MRWLDGEWQKIAHPLTVERQYLSMQGIAEGWLPMTGFI
jgi:hypothetical protein